MDIAALSIAMSEADLSAKVSTAVLAKSLDQAASTGEAMAEMLEPAKDPVRGQTIDITI